MRVMFKTILATSLILSVSNVMAADFANCPTAAVAQAIINGAAANLKPASASPAGWTLYQATATDLVIIDYYTAKAPPNLANQAMYLGTFIQGNPLNVDLPAGTPTLRHCYYPGTPGIGGTGNLDQSGNPLNTEVLALEYAPGVDPTPPGPGPGPTPPGPTPPGPIPPGQTSTVQVSLVFPTGVSPAAPSYITLVNSSNSYPATGITANSATINNVPYATAGTSYSYSASGVLIGTQNYCPVNGTVTISASSHSFTINYTACSVPPPSPGNKVIAYLLTADTIAGADGKLGTLMQQIGTGKPNFNRLVLSFLQPTFTTYTKGSLVCSGILGFYCAPATQVGSEQYEMTRKAQAADGVASFNAVKADIAQLKAQGVEVFLAVGGWDYSCNAPIYCQTLNFYIQDPAQRKDCTAATNYSYVCEPQGQPQKFDSFPEPGAGTNDYANLVALTKDLGADGIDLDYEEFWHADWNRRDFNSSNLIEAIRAVSYPPQSADMQQYFSSLSYKDIMNNPQYVSVTPNRTVGATNSFVMPDTVEKVVGITQDLVSASGSQGANLRFSIAAPAVGAIPVTSPQYGDSNVKTGGGIWWGGNLKGLMYEMEASTPGILNDFDTIAVMSYDLGTGSNDCGGSQVFQCPLQNQVAFYMQMYNTWLQGKPVIPIPVKPAAPTAVVPKQLAFKGHLAFGFEIGKPAYPPDGKLGEDWTTMVVTNLNLPIILTGLTSGDPTLGFSSDAMIMWEMNKPTSTNPKIVGTPVPPVGILNQTCVALGLDKLGYNCASSAPTPAPPGP